MTCYQTSSAQQAPATSPRYRTQAECLQACKEGACCETVNGVTTCSVKPQCQCQGAGKTFKGVGTTCESTNGACCRGNSCSVKPQCECQGSGNTFKGVGTTCSPNPCLCYCPDGQSVQPDTIVWSWYGGSAYLPPCTAYCWAGNTLQCEDSPRYLGALDFLYPQISGTYVLNRTACGVWRWSETSPIDGSTNTAQLSLEPTGLGTQYVAGLSKTVNSPGGVCRVNLSDGGAGFGSPVRFLSDLCEGQTFTPPGTNHCGSFVPGVGVASLPPSCIWPGEVNKPPGIVPILYQMQYTLRAG